MRSIYLMLMIFLSFFILTTGCKKDVMDQSPPTRLSDANYWNSASDLQLYANNFYGFLPSYGGFGNQGIYSIDNNSDNLVSVAYDRRLAGENTINNSGTFGAGNWSQIRNVNYFLANYSKVKDSWANISTYVGEAYFFRAWLYFNSLRTTGALPWINKPLNVDDSAYLYAERLPRNIIADSIIADLDNAIAALKPKSSAASMRIYKEYAQAFKARVCLYEGTWEKYHAGDAFGVQGQNGTKYLQLAAGAADAVISSAVFDLDNKNVADGYWKIFNQLNYSGSKEVMHWRAYNFTTGPTHNWQRYLALGAGTGLSKNLVDDYLCKDGLPKALSPLYQGDATLVKIATDRDPRLAQTIYLPGYTRVNNSTNTAPQTVFDRPSFDQSNTTYNTTGFQLYKGANPEWSQYNVAGTDGLIFMRYAEVLLIAAEAKAELGTFTQADADATINKLRSRVGMPPLIIAAIVSDPNWIFPSLSPVLNEVRRERRIELACEGFRFDDICRWAAAPQLIVNKIPLGAKAAPYITAFPSLPVNGDGYIQPYKSVNSLTGGYKFDIGRDYLLPLPILELVANPKLKQNPGNWQ